MCRIEKEQYNKHIATYLNMNKQAYGQTLEVAKSLPILIKL